jgi:hypothetical protein
MITRTQAYSTSDGRTHATLEDAQREEITALADPKKAYNYREMALWIFENREKLVDILTTTPTSKTKARRINGGKKNRAAAIVEPKAP